MKNRLLLNTSNALFVHLARLFLASLGVTTAAASSNAVEVCRIPPDNGSCTPISIKNTNYAIPSGAYFVATDGKTTNTGRSAASPWTVSKAFSSAPAGSTIIFRDGTYRNINAKLIDKKLTLQPYPNEKVWLKGSIEVQGWVADGTIWRKDSWTSSFPPNGSSSDIDSNYPMAGYRDMVYVDGIYLKQVASIAEVGPGKFYVDSINKKLYIGNNPVGKTVEATTQKQAFVLWKYDSFDPANTIIRGFGFAHYADEAIALSAARATFEDNTIVWNGKTGISFWGEGANGAKGVSTDAIVRGNTISYNGQSGVSGDRAHRILLENNIISHNNVERFSKIWTAAGIKIIRTDGLTWRSNLVENNFATGMWVDVSSVNAKIVSNTVRNNESIGIFFEISHNATIAGNVAYKNSTGIMISESSSTRIFNNTLSTNNRNLVIKDDTRKNTNSTEVAAGITWITRDNVVKNNIFSNAGASGVLFDASNWGTKELSTLMISSSDYNAYYRTLSSTPQNIIKWSLGDGWSNIHNANKWEVGYRNLTTFISEIGYETHGLEFYNTTPNPFFVDEPNGDFRLKPGSPAIGRGGALKPESAAAISVPAGVPIDLGAIQFK